MHDKNIQAPKTTAVLVFNRRTGSPHNSPTVDELVNVREHPLEGGDQPDLVEACRRGERVGPRAMTRAAISAAAAAALLALCACTDVTTNLVDDRGSGGANAIRDGGVRDAGQKHDAGAADARVATADGGNMSHGPAMCGDHVCQCDDGKDNDGDGLIDGLDPECTGPWDDDEATFATGLPTKTNGKCRDCFWDDNPGRGTEGCAYANACLRGLAPTTGACSCQVSQRCKDTCLGRTPNGCDCFGCCTVTQPDGGVVDIEFADSCSLAKIADTNACPRCKQSPDCSNPCGTCELCPGRKQADLPASCSGAQPGDRHTCDEGQPLCSANAPCAQDNYCQLGCCIYVVP
jgi:hypothetical protein